MNQTKLAMLILALSALAPAQLTNSAIRIEAVRKAAVLNADEQTVSCSDPNKDQNVQHLCDQLLALVSPDMFQVSFAVHVLAKPDARIDESAALSFLASAAESRLDTQNGATSGGSGTTSVVERSGISDVLGAALEAGAVTQSVSGSTLTLQGNALSLVRFLTPGANVFQYCPADKPNCFGTLDGFLNRISATASLGLSNQSTQTVMGTVANSGTISGSTGTASGSTSQMSGAALIQNSASHLTGLSIRFQALNKLDLRSQMYLDAWKKALMDPNLGNLAETANGKFESLFKAIYNPVSGNADYTWLAAAMDNLRVLALANASDSILEQAVITSWDQLVSRWPQNQVSTNLAALRDFLQAANAYMAARDLAINNVRQQLASGLTFEYDYSRPDNQPRISTARVIYTLHPGTIAKDMPTGSKPAATTSSNSKTTIRDGKVKPTEDSAVTFNFAADIYDNPPVGTGTLKDIQAALQLDHHFGNVIGTLAGYYQYQNQPSALMITSGTLAPGTDITLNGSAATLLAPRGHIVVAEAMVTIPLKSGTKLPVGVTWSNRTDLLKGNELRGHVGFNFDWSSLLLSGQASKPSN